MALKTALEQLLQGHPLAWATTQSLVETRPYRDGTRVKRDGTLRPIAEPAPELRMLQDYLVDVAWPALQVHEAAHGYVAGRSIVTHATQHAGAFVLVTMDLHDFFGHITEDRVVELLLSAGAQAQSAQVAAALCTKRPAPPLLPVLPQGAPTSPGLANAAFYWADCALSELAKGLGFVYSRYVDDLAFSLPWPWRDGPRKARRMAGPKLSGLRRGVMAVLTAAGFGLNVDKTRTAWWTQRQEVTGLIVNHCPRRPLVRAPRERWRELRRAVFEAAKYGASPKQLEELHGMASFLSMTDPQRARGYVEQLEALLKESK